MGNTLPEGHDSCRPASDCHTPEQIAMDNMGPAGDYPRLYDVAPDDRGDFGMPAVGSGFGPGRMWTTPADAKVDRVRGIIKEATDLYERKAAGYAHAGGDGADALGAKGQFSDINRKFWKLKGMLWDETIPTNPDEGCGESAEEVLMDLIGHAALTIDFLRQQPGPVTGPQS